MIISDLEHLEVVQEENQVEGGLAIATGTSFAGAFGDNLAVADTFTSTSATDSFFFFGPSASSTSDSTSIAA